MHDDVRDFQQGIEVSFAGVQMGKQEDQVTRYVYSKEKGRTPSHQLLNRFRHLFIDSSFVHRSLNVYTDLMNDSNIFV